MSIRNVPEVLLRLEETFEAVESSILLAQIRSGNRKVPFSIVQSSVEQRTQRRFSEQLLGQIMFILPNALTVSFSPFAPNSFTVSSSFIQQQPSANGPNIGEPADQPEISLQDRVKEFREGLVKYIREELAKYVQQNGSNEGFSIESACENIPSMPMPQVDVKVDHLFARVNRKRKASMELDKLVKRGMDKATKKKVRGLQGLPQSLVKKVQERKTLAREMAPEAILERHRAQARASLPSFLDMLFLFFRTSRKSKIELDKLVDTLVQRCGPNAFPAVATTGIKYKIIKGQLELLLELLPQWCFLTESKYLPGKPIFNVCISDDVDLASLRAQTRLKSL